MSLKDIYNKLSPYPLDGKELKEYYLDLFAVRGENKILTLKNRLLSDPGGKMHFLLVGFRGCGKSTELNKLKSEIEGTFLVANLQLQQELDLNTVGYVDILLLMMEKLFDIAQINNIAISKSYLKSIKNWTSTEEIEKVRGFSSEFESEVGVSGELGIPFFSKFFATLRNVSKLNYEAKKTITEVVERQLSDLINNCNDLIREIKLNLHKIGKKGLLLIVEDTDKLLLDRSEDLFFKYSPVFASLNTHTVFTFPIALQCNPRATLATAHFDDCFELPMVMIKNRQGFETDGTVALKKVIEKRIGSSLFEEKVLEKAIAMSGGCLRDLFRIVRDAADSAIEKGHPKITIDDCDTALRSLKKSFKNLIAEKRIDREVLVSTQTYLDVLVSLFKSSDKQLLNTEADLDLRHNLCILGYDGDGWYDVHPIVVEILRERGLIDALPQ